MSYIYGVFFFLGRMHIIICYHFVIIFYIVWYARASGITSKNRTHILLYSVLLLILYIHESSIKTLASGHGISRVTRRHRRRYLFIFSSPLVVYIFSFFFFFHFFLNNIKTNVIRMVRNVKNERQPTYIKGYLERQANNNRAWCA